LTVAAVALLLTGELAAQDVGGARGAPSEAASGTRSTSGSRLVVVIVVDQLATWVLRAAWPHLGDQGFRRLEREGAVFERCAFRHACTVTAPGHATIATGAHPRSHGIVGNDWIDPDTLGAVGSVDDKGTKLLPSGAIGASPHRLRAPTLVDALEVAFGSASRSASVGLKDRSAILLAGASADYVVWFDKAAGLLSTSTAFVKAGDPAGSRWLDELNRLRPVEAFHDFVWRRSGPPAAYEDLEDDDDPVEYPIAGTRTFPHDFGRIAGLSRKQFVEQLVISPAGSDLVWTAAKHLARHARLGEDDVPDFLGICLSSNDWVGHVFGPDSHEVRDMTLRTDALLAEVLAHFDATVGAGRYHVVLTADHGVGTVPEVAARRGVPAGRVPILKLKLAVEGAMRARYGEPPPGEHWYAGIGDAGIMLNRRLLAARGIAVAEAQSAAATAVASVKGIALAIPGHALATGGVPRDEIHEAILLSYVRESAADVRVVPKPDHLIGPTAASHGTPYAYDREVPLFLSGPGVKRGYRCRDPVAPGSAVVTIAAALGIAPPARAEHPVLDGALSAR
jgi:hypothetical protein